MKLKEAVEVAGVSSVERFLNLAKRLALTPEEGETADPNGQWSPDSVEKIRKRADKLKAMREKSGINRITLEQAQAITKIPVDILRTACEAREIDAVKTSRWMADKQSVKRFSDNWGGSRVTITADVKRRVDEEEAADEKQTAARDRENIVENRLRAAVLGHAFSEYLMKLRKKEPVDEDEAWIRSADFNFWSQGELDPEYIIRKCKEIAGR